MCISDQASAGAAIVGHWPETGGWLGLSLRTPSDHRHDLGVREEAQPQPPHSRDRS
ncbi:hypothetical protein [Planctopirus limnophila]|uniref:hypothetical protein n=1 Tax=Planctopirus limnophila TaxID=120 RepID=UPI0002E8D1DD|nr:hypothetical protein [Planctopirus limnophila]